MILGYIPIPKDEQAVLLHLLYEEQVELLHQHQTLPVVHRPLEEVTIIRLQVTVLTHLEEVQVLSSSPSYNSSRSSSSSSPSYSRSSSSSSSSGSRSSSSSSGRRGR